MTLAFDTPVFFAFAGFVSSVAVIVGVGLFVISVVMRFRRRHRRRLARVGRGRVIGRMDVAELRGNLLLRPSTNNNKVDRMLDALARVLPLLDTKRIRADLERAGLRMRIGGFIGASLLTGVAVALAARMAAGVPGPVAAISGCFGGMVAVNAVIRALGERRAQRFLKQMPDALDAIVRGIRAGLPVIECIGMAGRDMPDPLGAQFRDVHERVQLGETIDVALWHAGDTIRRPEMDFLAVSISIQSEIGGSLTDALNNLSEMLRKRETMKLKIRAVSSEAKASAMIIGALPVVMLALLAFMSPDYVAPLFSDPRGNMMLGAGLGSMSVGAFVMWRMTKFEI